MSVAESLMKMKRLPKRPAGSTSTDSPVKAAEDTQSPAKRLEELTAWLANRDEPALEAAKAEGASDDPVESSVLQFLKEQETRKGKRKARKSSVNTG